MNQRLRRVFRAARILAPLGALLLFGCNPGGQPGDLRIQVVPNGLQATLSVNVIQFQVGTLAGLRPQAAPPGVLFQGSADGTFFASPQPWDKPAFLDDSAVYDDAAPGQPPATTNVGTVTIAGAHITGGSADVPWDSISGDYSSPGSFVFSNDPAGQTYTYTISGGAGIPAFTRTIMLPTTYPEATAPDLSGITSYPRKKNLLFQWKLPPAGPKSYFYLDLTPTFPNTKGIYCLLADDGSFAVSSTLLSQLSVDTYQVTLSRMILDTSTKLPGTPSTLLLIGSTDAMGFLNLQ